MPLGTFFVVHAYSHRGPPFLFDLGNDDHHLLRQSVASGAVSLTVNGIGPTGFSATSMGNGSSTGFDLHGHEVARILSGPRRRLGGPHRPPFATKLVGVGAHDGPENG